MFFKRNKHTEEQPPANTSPKKSFLVWLEIGVTDMTRSSRFYEAVFMIKTDVKNFSNGKIGTFYKDNICLNVCLKEKGKAANSNTVKPTFFVSVISEVMLNVEKHGGKIVSPPELLRQQNEKGETLIGANLIDNHLGYMAEITDPDGNAILVYAHS
ncbi:MAG: hypothetical protein HYX39_08235 [Bacteroidetes bacterium]|nr:hypothetical protein [Bacteroidota bacterium]